MAVNYEDERFKQVDAEKEKALNNVNDTYNNMINNSDQYYQDLRNTTEEWGEQQKQLQQEKTDFLIDTINQQKDWAEQDYKKEQSGAYVDYRKQMMNAPETVYSQGMKNTGWSETSLRDIWGTYQNRVATARDSFNRAVVNYDNSIKEAMLSNNSALAEISYNTLKEALTYSLQGFQYKNDLIEKQLQMINNTEDRYYSRWKDVLDQINTENALEEQKRQFDEQMALQWASRSGYGGGGSYDMSGGSDEAIDTVSDAKKYGTFSNGYQPKGVGNHGTLTKTGRTAVAGNGKTQNVWQAEDGTYWFWDGNTRTYVPFASFYDTKAISSSGGGSGKSIDGAKLEKTSIPGVSKITNAGTPLDKGLRKLDLRENSSLIQDNSSGISTFRNSKNWKTKTINGKVYEGLEYNGKFYACFNGNQFYEVQ